MAEMNRDDIAKLEALYAENPEGRVFIHLAEAYRRAGELDRALEVVNDGISRYAEDSSAHVVLGRVLEDRQQDEEAAAAFRRVLDLDAHNLVALRGLGDLAFRAGNHEAALEYFERLADLEPPDGELEALIEALRSGPAGMAEALKQWEGETPSEPESGPEAVDFAGGTLDDGGPREPDLAAEDIEAAGAVEEGSFAEQGSPAPEEEGAESPEPRQSAVGEAMAEPWAEREEEEPEGAPTPLSGLVPEDELRGSDAAEDVEALDVSERDFQGDVPAETELPEIGGLNGLQTADSPISGEPPRDTTWDADEGAEEEAAEATQTVFTETMAQVYARQGLYERAADVYRELLRQRPDDPTLQTRLAEMQDLQAGAGEAAEKPEASVPEDSFPFLDATPPTGSSAEPEAEPAGEVWEPDYAADAASGDVDAQEPGPADDGGLPEAEEAPAVGAEPEYAWEPEAEQSAAEPEGATEPEAAMEPEAAAEPEAATEPEYAIEPEYAAESEYAAEPEVAREGEEAAEAEAIGEPESAAEPGFAELPELGALESRSEAEAGVTPAYTSEASAAPESPAEGEDVEDVESVWTGAAGAVAGEETPYSWTEPEEPGSEATGEGIRSYLLRLAGWSAGSVGPTAGSDDVHPGGVQPPETAEEAQPAEAREPNKPAGGVEAAPSGGDDDLDMFRAWLESLKR